MKRITFLVLALIVAWACQQAPSEENVVEAALATEAASQSSTNMPDSLLRHVVLFKFKDEATPEDIQKVEAAFGALPAAISEIHDYEWGINNSPEGLNQGLTHCFLITFKSEADREIYLPHPAHKAFVEVLSPHLDKVTVVDYWTK